MDTALLLICLLDGIAPAPPAEECGMLCDMDFWQTATGEDVQALIDAGEHVNGRSDFGFTPLHMAAIMESTQFMEVLMSADADVNAWGVKGITPLMQAVHLGSPENVTYLLENGADVNIRMNGAGPAIWWALANPNYDTLTVMLEAGADINAQSCFGTTLLHNVAGLGQGDSIERLLALGADGSILDIDGKTPFDLANPNARSMTTAAYSALEAAQNN